MHWIRRPTAGALGVLAAFVAIGVALLYAPAQVTDTDSWQAELGDWIAVFGMLTVVGSLVVFCGLHIRYPAWLLRLGKLRLSFTDTNQWLVDAARHQEDSLDAFIVFTGHELLDRRFDQTEERPYLTFLVHAHNASLHTIVWSDVSGVVQYNGSPLRDNIQKPCSNHGGV